MWWDRLTHSFTCSAIDFYICGTRSQNVIQVSQQASINFFLGFHFVENVGFSRICSKKTHTHEKKRTKRGGSPLTRHMGQSANSHINIESKRYVKMLTKPKTVCIFGLLCGNGSYFVRHKSGTRSHTVMLLSFGATDESERKNIMIIYWEEMRWNLKRNYFWKRMKK